jgi:asparagine synthetase A
MPPTKSSLSVFKVVSREGLVAYQEAESLAKAERLLEIEGGLMVQNGIYFNMKELMTNPDLKNVCKMILCQVDFESLIAARMVSKTWYRYLENDREIWISTLKKRLKYLKEGSWCDYNRTYIDNKYPPIQVLFKGGLILEGIFYLV